MNLEEIRAAVLAAKPDLEIFLEELQSQFPLDRTVIARELDSAVIDLLNKPEMTEFDLTPEKTITFLKALWETRVKNLLP